jgi:putative sigma-54 modulation protein
MLKGRKSMDVTVETHHVKLPPNNRASLAARIAGAFARFSHHVTGLRVTLKDINGPRGGRDKECVVRVDLSGGGQVVVVDRGARMGAAMLRSVRRAKLLVAGEIKRRRRRNRINVATRSRLHAGIA